jgi:hypothetical protein
MTVCIEVKRGAGDRDGGEIMEPLLGDSLPAALARGRAALDQTACAFDRVSLSLDYAPGLYVGHRVQVADPDMGETWQGMIVGVAHAFDGQSSETQLEVERAREV